MTQTREVTQSPENEKLVHEIYRKHQENNQKAHDEARASIAAEFNLSEEEAEGHPEMEPRFEQLRANMTLNSGVTSVDPNTGEPGVRVAPVARPAPAPAPVPAATPAAASPPIYTSAADIVTLENLIRSNGFTVLQSASDYSQGIITLVITR
jgi:hypothetical protein